MVHNHGMKLLCAVLLAVCTLAGQDIGPGKLLVARPNLPDENFAESVILITRSDKNGVMGLVLNRPGDVRLAELLPDLKLKNGDDPAYSGGPIDEELAFALLESKTKVASAIRVFGDVYLIMDESLLQKSARSSKSKTEFRIYVGYCGWEKEQLQGELELDAWMVMPATADIVFDPDPETLWERLIKKPKLQIVLAQPPRVLETTSSDRRKR